MQKEPLASAVIITYNQEKYIAQVIDCALAQKVDFPYEIVIGEDCSTDRTREICLQYQEKYPDIIRVITSDKNVGLLDNWYRSVKAARGKYIAGCGGDDYWHNPDKMQKQVHFLEENPEFGMTHSEADFYVQKTNNVIRNYHFVQKHYIINEFENILERIVAGQYPITACTAVYRKMLFDRYFIIEQIKRNKFLMEDTPFWIEIARHSKIHYLPESLATYRVLEDSVSRSLDRKKALLFNSSSAEMRLFYCQKYKLTNKIKNEQEKRWRRVTLQLAFLEKQPELADSVFQRYPDLSIKEWIWYAGTKYSFMRPLVILLRTFFQRGMKDG